jgi:DNA-binding CsgD family transcriptional regulator
MILIERVSEGVRIEDVRDVTKLTQREQIVVQLLSEGKTNKEIATYMDIGEYTVKDHMKRIMKKLKVTTRAGIVAKILQSHHLS